MRTILKIFTFLSMIAFLSGISMSRFIEGRVISEEYKTPNSELNRTIEYKAKGTYVYVDKDDFKNITISNYLTWGGFATFLTLAILFYFFDRKNRLTLQS